MEGRAPEAIAPLIPAPLAVPLTLTLGSSDGTVFRHRVITSRALHDQAMAPSTRRSEALEMVAWPPLAIPLLLAGGLRLWRQRGRMVPTMLAFSFALVATLPPGALEYAESAGIGWLLQLLLFLVAPTLFAIALPAFPDGRYVPRGARWIIPAAVASALLLIPMVFVVESAAIILFLLPRLPAPVRTGTSSNRSAACGLG